MREWKNEIDHYRLLFEDINARARAGELDARQALIETRAGLDALSAALCQAESHPILLELLDSITDGLFALDREWRLVYINRTAAENAGSTPRELIHANLWDMFPGYVGGEVEQALRRVMERGSPESFEIAGSPDRYYTVTAYPTPDGIVVFRQEKTAQKMQAQASEEDVIFQSTSDALIVYDHHGEMVRANLAARHLFGGVYPAMKPSSGLEAGGIELYTADGQPVEARNLPIRETIRSGRPSAWIPLHCHLPDGRQMELNVSASPLLDASGRFFGAVTVWHDITDLEMARRRAEQEANRAGLLAEELNSVFAAMADSVIVFNSQGDPVRMNPAARDQYNFDVIQTPLEETMTRIQVRKLDGSPLTVEELPSRRALRGELILGEPSIQIHPDGSDQTILSSAAPIFDSSGRITGSVVVWHDITDVEQVQFQYRRQREVLERVIEQAPVGVFLLDGPDHRFTLGNRVLQTYFQGQGSVLGRPLAEVWPEMADQFIPVLDQIYSTGERFQIDGVFMRVDRGKGPEEAFFSCIYTPILGAGGKVESILAMLWETPRDAQKPEP